MMLVKDDVMLVTLRVTGKRSSYFILIHALCCPPLVYQVTGRHLFGLIKLK